MKTSMPSWIQPAEIVCTVIVVMAGYLMFANEATNDAVVVFRVGVLATGLCGYAGLQLWKRRFVEENDEQSPDA